MTLGDTWKKESGAWNIFNSGSLSNSCKHLTTIITPFRRCCYRRGRQGYQLGGQLQWENYDRIEGCIDDLLHSVTDFEEHGWHTLRLVIPLAEYCEVFNPDKFEFTWKRSDLDLSIVYKLTWLKLHEAWSRPDISHRDVCIYVQYISYMI